MIFWRLFPDFKPGKGAVCMLLTIAGRKPGPFVFDSTQTAKYWCALPDALKKKASGKDASTSDSNPFYNVRGVPDCDGAPSIISIATYQLRP